MNKPLLLVAVIVGLLLVSSVEAARVKAKGKTRARADSAQDQSTQTTAAATPSANPNPEQSKVGVEQAAPVLDNAQQLKMVGNEVPRFLTQGAESKVKEGGDWWLEDVPWFLPPPPEWGPMPPTMYTSFYHKPRHPPLSTANYYPLFSRTGEYTSHVPATLDPRAIRTTEQFYDHYVWEQKARSIYAQIPTHDAAHVAVTSGTHWANSDYVGGLPEANARIQASSAANNYFPLFSRTMDYYTSPVNKAYPNWVGTSGLSFVEQSSHMKRMRGNSNNEEKKETRSETGLFTTHFLSDSTVSYKQ